MLRTPTLLLLLLLPLLLSPTPTTAADHNTFDFAKIDDNNDNRKKTPGECSIPGGGTIRLGEDRLYKDHKENCTILLCSDKKKIHQVIKQCIAPPCVNPQLKGKSACCASCKNGRNCRLPNGEILWGTNVTQMGQALCRCPKMKSELGWDEDLATAVCIITTTPAPTTTTPVPDCRLPEEKEEEKEEKKEKEKEEKENSTATVSRLLEPGKEKIVPKDDDCRKYVCDARGQLTTYHGKCPQLNCTTNGTRESGACCKTCPDDLDAASSEPTSYVRTSPRQRKRTFVAVDFFTLLRFLLFGQTSNHHHHHRSSSSAKTTGTKTGAKKTTTGSSKKGGFFMIFHFGSSGGHHGGHGGHHRHRTTG